MNYLFFDIECANCFQGVGKICEFGYAYFDQDFKLIKKENLFINPESSFHLSGRSKNNPGISLSQSNSYYRKQPNYIFFHKRIKEILTKKNTLYFAYSSRNDMYFLLKTMQRYDQKIFNFTCYDAQVIAANYTQEFGKFPSLINMYELLVKNGPELVDHQACFDAYKTGLIVKEIIKKLDVDLPSYLKKLTNPSKSLIELNEIEISRNNLAQLKAQLSIEKSKLNDDEYIGKRYVIFNEIKADKDLYISVLNKLIKNKNYVVSSLKNADYALYVSMEEKKILKELNKRFKTFRLVQVNKLLGK